MNAGSLTDSIERYAELCAHLDAAFHARGEVLRAANLDEGGFLHLQAHWASRLIALDGADMAARFGTAYAEARSSPRELTRSREESGTRPSPTPCRIHEPPIRPAPALVAAAETTSEMPVFPRQRPVLPFASPQAPCRRLHRFDTQTGLPLRTPVWIDDASDPRKPA